MTSYFKIKRSKHLPIIIIYRSFHTLRPNVAGFSKKFWKWQKKAHLKRKDEGRAFYCGSNEKVYQNVARTRKWGGSQNIRSWQLPYWGLQFLEMKVYCHSWSCTKYKIKVFKDSHLTNSILKSQEKVSLEKTMKSSLEGYYRL